MYAFQKIKFIAICPLFVCQWKDTYFQINFIIEKNYSF
jgi:hypothetical protein